jgi:hypothetical protein
MFNYALGAVVAYFPMKNRRASHSSRDSMKKTGRIETIVSIQILRAVAALGIAVYHIAGEPAHIGSTSAADNVFGAGAAGVDLFFIISGFVMVYASTPLFGSLSGASTFFRHHLPRCGNDGAALAPKRPRLCHRKKSFHGGCERH